MGRPWDDRRHVEIAKAIRGRCLRVPAFIVWRRRERVTYVAARSAGGVTIGYWAGPVLHVRGQVKPVALDKAYRATSVEGMRATLDGCGLVGVFEIVPVRRE